MRAPPAPAPPLWRSGPAAFRPGDFRATRPGPCSSTNRAPPGEKNKEAAAQGPLGLSGRVFLCSLPGCAGGRGEGARGAGFRGCRTHLPGRGRQRGKGASRPRPLLPLPLWREPSFPAARLAVSMAPQRPQVSAVPRGRVQRGVSGVPGGRSGLGAAAVGILSRGAGAEDGLSLRFPSRSEAVGAAAAGGGSPRWWGGRFAPI